MDSEILKIKITLACETDAEALLEIYSPYVLDSTVSFETVPPEIGEFRRRIKEYGQWYPWLVCRACFADGKQVVAGYAYGSPQGARAAYCWNVQYSIYLADFAKGFGVARALYQALEKLVVFQGYKTAYALISCPNLPSEQFHKKWGFQKLALHKNTGFKRGKWLDVLWMSKVLSFYDIPPCPPLVTAQIPVPELERVFYSVEQSFIVNKSLKNDFVQK